MNRFRHFTVTCLLAFSLAVFVHGESTATGTLLLVTVSSPHETITWSAPEAKLQDSGLWNSRHEPRLSITQAVSLARSHLKSHGQQDQLPLLKIELRRPQKFDRPNEFYFYFITFDDPRSLDPTTRQDVVVLLDGSVVEPVRTKT
jgi:hypothetical protein